MPLDLPPGAVCFVDANIFVYHFIELGEVSARCRALLGRVARNELQAVSASACLADAVHRVMGVEAQDRFKIASGAVAWLQRHPDRIGELSAFRDAARQLAALPLRLLSVDAETVADAADISARHGLLMNDAAIVSLMRRHNIPNLVTNDDDFDQVPGIAIWKPH